MGVTLQMKIFSIIHTFLGCFLPSDMPQLSSAKYLRDSRGQNDDNSITNHAIMDILLPYMVGGGGPPWP